MFVTLQTVQESEKKYCVIYMHYICMTSKFTPNITIEANGFLNTKIYICFGEMMESPVFY